MELAVFLIIFFYVFSYGDARLSEQIYFKLDLPSISDYCFTLLNGTHQFGCQANLHGSTGVVVYAENAHAFEQINAKFDAALNLIVAIDIEFFNQKAIKFLLEDRVSGVLLLYGNTSLVSNVAFSEDATCPNKGFGLYHGECQKEWNADGAIIPEGLRYTSWKKPMFIIRNATAIKIIKDDCYWSFNYNGSMPGVSLCSARLGAHMTAAGNAEICLGRNPTGFVLTDSPRLYCAVLEDKNVISVIPPPQKGLGKRKFFLIASRMDSLSMFGDTILGEVSVLTSLMSAVAVAEAVGRNLNEFQDVANRSRHSLMFSFLHGESLGLIGSSRMIYDMIQGVFPVKIQGLKPDIQLIEIDDIDAFLEVQMISANGSLFAHVDGKSYFDYRKNMVNDLVNAANKKLLNDGFSSTVSLLSDLNRETQLPPSSIGTFLKYKRSIAGFVVAPFSSHYEYKKINSIADRIAPDERNATIKQIVTAATAVLGAALSYVYGDEKTGSQFRISESFVSTLYDCFITAADWQTCNLFQQILQEDETFKTFTAAEKRYKETTVGTASQVSFLRLLVKALMVYTLGSKELVNVNTRDQCNDLNKNGQLYLHTWQRNPDMNTSICYRNSLYLTEARSPAFDITGYDYKSGEYSTWVQSASDSPELVLFLTPPYRSEFDLVVMIVGFLLLLFSCFAVEIVYLSNRQFFDPPAPSLEADKTAAPL